MAASSLVVHPATCPDHIPAEKVGAVAIAEIAHRRGWELSFAYDNQDRLSVVAEKRELMRGIEL